MVALTLEEQLEEGRRQWTIAWRRFARQWTQPQLLKLADAVLGGRYLHSSQISGFATGKLREPSPKVFLAIGRVNQAIANGDIGVEYKELWAGKQCIVDGAGTVLDAVGCFRAFTGELDLGLEEILTIPEDQAEEANMRLGKFVRGELARAGVDFIESMPKLVKIGGPLIKPVLLGECLDSEDLVESLEQLEAVLQWCNLRITTVHLLDVALQTRRRGYYVDDYAHEGSRE